MHDIPDDPFGVFELYIGQVSTRNYVIGSLTP